MGLTGPIWCLLAGVCYGLLNLFAKLSFEAGMKVPHFILWRHVYQALFSSSFGMAVRGVSFNLFNYSSEVNKVLIGRSLINTISKSMQFASIAYIPLSLSSTISFTTGPMFAAVLAFIVIGERLDCLDVTTISFGVLGTVVLSMPHWFAFLNLDGDELLVRY